MPFYSGFHLHIDSDLVIPELQQTEGNISYDVIIREKKIENYVKSSQNLKYNFENGLEFWVNEGKEIFYHNPRNIDDKIISACLMDYPIIGLLYQRGFVAIHGSCIVFNEKAGIIVTGFSGAGKSTTASLFRRKGYSIMGDEIGAIRIDNDDTPQLYPSYPEIGLWETSLNLLNDNELAQRGRSRFGSTKYDIAVADSFHDQTVPLKAIFRLEPTDEIEGEVITQLRGIHAMQELRENSLNYLSSVEEFGFLNEYFKKCASLCDKVPIYKVQRLKNNAELYPTADIIEKYVKENSII